MAEMPLVEEVGEVITSEGEASSSEDRKPRKRASSKGATRKDARDPSIDENSQASAPSEPRSARKSSRAGLRSEGADKPLTNTGRRRKTQATSPEEAHSDSTQITPTQQQVITPAPDGTPLQQLIEAEYTASPNTESQQARESQSQMQIDDGDGTNSPVIPHSDSVQHFPSQNDQDQGHPGAHARHSEIVPNALGSTRPEPFRAKHRSGSPSLKKEPMVLRPSAMQRSPQVGETGSRHESPASSTHPRGLHATFDAPSSENRTISPGRHFRSEAPSSVISPTLRATEDVPHFTDDDFEEETAFYPRQRNRGRYEPEHRSPTEPFRFQADAPPFSPRASHRNESSGGPPPRDSGFRVPQSRDSGSFESHEGDVGHRGSARPRRGPPVNHGIPRDRLHGRRGEDSRFSGPDRYESHDDSNDEDYSPEYQDRTPLPRKHSRGASSEGNRHDEYPAGESRSRNFGGAPRPSRPSGPRHFSRNSAQESSQPQYGSPRGQRGGFRDQDFNEGRDLRSVQPRRHQGEFNSASSSQGFDSHTNQRSASNYGNRPGRGERPTGFRKAGGHQRQGQPSHSGYDGDFGRGQQDVPWAQRTQYGTRDAASQERRFGNGSEGDYGPGFSGHGNVDQRQGRFSGRKSGFRPR
jgi:hypothetical protein